MGKIFVIGIGPGDPESLSARAKEALAECDVIAGYKTYTGLVRTLFPDKEIFENGMRGELERCEKCLSLAKEGRKVALICSGDAGIYGMASPMLTAAAREGFEEVEVIPGITSASSGAALLGAPLSHDFCVISLSDLLTPWKLIEKRLKYAAAGDFVIVLYNPASRNRPEHMKKACEILLSELPDERICGYVKNIGRKDTMREICTLKELMSAPVDMVTTVFIGNSETKALNGWIVTPRGYPGLT